MSPDAPIEPPAASFTHSENELTVDLDGTGSTDTDGAVTSYAWDFGDGTTGSGSITEHTYLTGGTFDFALTVTDNRGGTDTETQQINVTAPANHPFCL